MRSAQPVLGTTVRRVVLHVGTPKSGTTYLQRVLEANRPVLAEHGVVVHGRERVDLVHAAMVVRDDPRLERLPARAATAWERLCGQVRESGARVDVVSYELFAGATAEQAARAIEDLQQAVGPDGVVEVVVTGRDLGRALGSAWQERLKFALTAPAEEWTPPGEDVVRSEWGWRTLDPSGVAERWSSGLDDARIHVVTVPRGGAPEELWRRFAAALGLDDVPVDPGLDRANQTLGPAAAEVLRRVNEQVGAPLDTNREQALWLRDLLAHEILAGLDPTPFGTSPHLLDLARGQFEIATARFEGRGYTWHGSLEELAPTAAQGLTPGATSVQDQLDVAVRAVYALLLRVRDLESARTSAARQAAEAAPAAPRTPWRALLARRDVVVDRVAELQAEVDRLNADLDASRRLQHRVAMLTDLVGELLVPHADQDERLLTDFVRAYRPEAL